MSCMRDREFGDRQARETNGLQKRFLGKVRSQIVEGVFFEKSLEQDRTFEDMMTRYMAERSILKAPKSRIRDSSALKHLLPVFGPRALGHMTPKMFAEYKVQRRLEGAAQRPRTRNSSWCGTPSIWPCANGNGARTTPCTVCPLSRCETKWTVG